MFQPCFSHVTATISKIKAKLFSQAGFILAVSKTTFQFWELHLLLRLYLTHSHKSCLQKDSLSVKSASQIFTFVVYCVCCAKVFFSFLNLDVVPVDSSPVYK